MTPAPFEVLSIGRVGVDLYPTTVETALAEVPEFEKFLGGSATNVAVAAARLGRTSAIVTRTGADPFGEFVRTQLRAFNVSDRFVGTSPGNPTPITFCELFPPDDFPLWFYRSADSPDLQIAIEDLDVAAVASAGVLWCTATGLSVDPSRSAHHAAFALRRPEQFTVLDLDYRAVFWESEQAARNAVLEALPKVSVAIGNLAECLMATGYGDPIEAAKALLNAGAQLAVVKLGPDGALAMSATETIQIPGLRVRVLNGLGAGDGFGGALCHGLLAGWKLAETLAYANAAGAIVASRLGCSSAMPTPAEVATLLDDPQDPRGMQLTSVGSPTRASSSIDLSALREIRATNPLRIKELHLQRTRRPLLAGDGRLMLVAADHPARGSMGVRDNPQAMANRGDLLRRLVEALSRPGVDGVVATADVVDDLLLLGALDNKVVIGSMNRGGLQGAVFELDDRFTGYQAAGISAANLEGGKMLCRVALDDAGTASTLVACGQAVTQLSELGLLAMVEPFLSRRVGNRVEHDLSAAGVAKAVAIASGLGSSSAQTWLKLPAIDDLAEVMAATTLPTLLLGGDPTGSPKATYNSWRRSLAIQGVRGLVIGRAVLYPQDGDVSRAVDIATELVHS